MLAMRNRAKYEVSERKFRRILEKRARFYFDMSLDDFIARMDSGDLPRGLAADDLAFLVGSLPRR